MEQVIDKLLEKCFSFMDEIVELSTIVEGLRKEVSQLKEENKELKDEMSKMPVGIPAGAFSNRKSERDEW